jgi:hypothetical protein
VAYVHANLTLLSECITKLENNRNVFSVKMQEINDTEGKLPSTNGSKAHAGEKKMLIIFHQEQSV